MGGTPLRTLEEREAQFDRIDATLDRMVDGLSDIKAKIGDVEHRLSGEIAEVRGRLSGLPTTWQMVTWMIGIALGGVGLLAAIGFGIARFVIPG